MRLKSLREKEQDMEVTFKMTKKWKVRNTKAIINNLQLVFKTGDIEKLNGSTYDFLYLLSGFIAHYDLYGFRAYYQDLRELIKDLQDSHDIAYPRLECSEDCEQIEYYQSKLNTALATTLNKEADNQGVQIVRVEMMEITPPEDVQDTMNKVLKAENEKRAAIDFATAAETQADGQRRAEIKKAEGMRQAAILAAEGVKQATILEAEGKAKAFDLINHAFVGNAQILKKLETVQASLENNTKYVIDPHTGITNVIAEQMAGLVPIKEKEHSE